jgi:hypothetical protein
LAQLPVEVQQDFLTDPTFKISLDDCEPGRGRTVVMSALGPNGVSRCVVLKPRLETKSDAFACYIVAHELAHAWLHNGGWGEITDREEAADAVAASWGFAKVPYE